jgi:hypothetical protein
VGKREEDIFEMAKEKPIQRIVLDFTFDITAYARPGAPGRG